MSNPEDIIGKINILVVDDMEAIRSMINSCLKEIGADRVTMSCNGESAWEALKHTRIDLIICDWDMPELSGLELLVRVRGSASHRHIPFLMLTGTTEKEKVMSAIEAGVNDYLAKPFQPKELEYRVIKLLRKVKLN